MVAVDRDGLVTVIETKLGRNPEVKRTVVTPVLGDAASLWGLSYGDFDRDLAQRYFSGGQCPEPDLNGLALDEAMARCVEVRALGGEWDRSGFREQLGANLAADRGCAGGPAFDLVGIDALG